MKFELIGVAEWGKLLDKKVIAVSFDWTKIDQVKRDGLDKIWLIPTDKDKFRVLGVLTDVLDAPAKDGGRFEKKNINSIMAIKNLLETLSKDKSTATDNAKSSLFTINFLLLLVESLAYLGRNRNPTAFRVWLEKQSFDSEVVSVFSSYLKNVEQDFLPEPVIYEPGKKG